MSNTHSNAVTKHVKKKAKQDLCDQLTSSSFRQSYKAINNPTPLEPRRDLPLHKIPELLAKITGTFSPTLNTSESKSSGHPSLLPSSTYVPIDRNLEFFGRYSQGDIITVDGLLRLCADLTIEPDCYEVLLFCFLCRAKQMYSLTKTEFLLGLKTLGTRLETLTDIRNGLMNYVVSSHENEFYIWTYHYGLTDGQRCLTTHNAISLWRLFYSREIPKPFILDRWLKFLEEDTSHTIPKTITCDTWTIFPQFAKFIESNGYQAYDDSEAWPCLFDDFVEYETDQHKKCEPSSSSN